jgi:hypothetical protein
LYFGALIFYLLQQHSRPHQIKDGDILQLGVDYQGGAEDIYKSVKIRVELGREWQAGVNAFKCVFFQSVRVMIWRGFRAFVSFRFLSCVSCVSWSLDAFTPPLGLVMPRDVRVRCVFPAALFFRWRDEETYWRGDADALSSILDARMYASSRLT